MNFAIIFDMDGTLFQTEKILVPALHKTFAQLRKEDKWEGETPVEQYLQILGVTLKEVWRQLLPNAIEGTREQADQLFLGYLVEEIKNGNGKLYPQVKESIQMINQIGIPMFVASNGLEHYIRAICEYYELGTYFVDQYSAGRFNCSSKSILVQMLIEKYGIKEAVMVGDRLSDIEAGKQNGLWTIGCHFGFANEKELMDADYLIKSFQEIIPLVNMLQEKS
jgi:phosphoglycolate phosphatase